MTAQINHNIELEKIPEQVINDLLGKMVAVSPKTVCWSEIPIEEISMVLLIKYVGPALNIPYYYSTKYSGQFTLRLIGEVTDPKKWNYGRTFEFWTIANLSQIEVL